MKNPFEKAVDFLKRSRAGRSGDGRSRADVAVAPAVAHGEHTNEPATLASGGFRDSEVQPSSKSGFVTNESIANSAFASSAPDTPVDNLKPAEGIEPSSLGVTNPDSHQAAGSISDYHTNSLARASVSIKTTCPYCNSADFVKRGLRKKKHEIVQLYVCRAEGCGRTFTAERVKGKRFPLAVILEGISYYNLGLTLEQTCNVLEKKFSGIEPPIPATLSSWVEQYKPLCRFERMRPYAMKLYPPNQMVEVVSMAHRQLYRFRYHRAKTLLSMEEFKNRRFGRLKEYLDAVSSETPHQYFAEGGRMSEVRSKFDKADMIVRAKHNFANDLAEFVLRSVAENKDRHEALQRFMIANDSVTVATEVPVYIRREDIEHLENELKFKVVGEEGIVMKGDTGKGNAGKAKATSAAEGLPSLLTGHIDFVQIRNGMIHILDYKPNASKEKPIEQLTWYALALSRLTGLRLFEFKCAWFDDRDYYEFYPLHVVKKLRPAKRARKVRYRDGSTAVIPSENALTVV